MDAYEDVVDGIASEYRSEKPDRKRIARMAQKGGEMLARLEMS